MAAHGPQEIRAALVGIGFASRQDAPGDGIVAHPCAIQILDDPVQRMDIAQATFAVLEVGLDDVARASRLARALVTLGELGLDEGAAVARRDFLAEAGLQTVEQGLVAENQAGIEQRRADRQIFGRQAKCTGPRSGWHDRPCSRDPTESSVRIRRCSRPRRSACRAAGTADRYPSPAPAVRVHIPPSPRHTCARHRTGHSPGRGGRWRNHRSGGQGGLGRATVPWRRPGHCDRP